MSYYPPRFTERKNAVKKVNKDVWNPEFELADCPKIAEELYDEREIDGDGFTGTEWGGENFAAFNHLKADEEALKAQVQVLTKALEVVKSPLQPLSKVFFPLFMYCFSIVYILFNDQNAKSKEKEAFADKQDAWSQEAKTLEVRINHCNTLITSLCALMERRSTRSTAPVTWEDCPELSLAGKKLIERCDPLAFRALVLKQEPEEKLKVLQKGLDIVTAEMQKAIVDGAGAEKGSDADLQKKHAELWVTQNRQDSITSKIADLQRKAAAAAEKKKKVKQGAGTATSSSSSSSATSSSSSLLGSKPTNQGFCIVLFMHYLCMLCIIYALFMHYLFIVYVLFNLTFR
jgi:hypothetical protein